MNLDEIEKHIHLTELPNGSVEIMFGGQPCLTVSETFDGGYGWRINPVFAKLTYGANIFEDVPMCFVSLDTVEDSIAEGLTALNDVGAFHGVVELPADSYAEEHLDESFAVHDKSGKVISVHGAESAAKQKAKELSTPTNQHTVKFAREATMTESFAVHDKSGKVVSVHGAESAAKKKAAELSTADNQHTVKFAREATMTESDFFESVMKDCRKAALKHSDSILEAHDLAQGLFESVVNEAALSGDAYWKAKEDAARELKAKEERASMGIKEPVKKGRGKPTNIDLEFVHAAALKNVEAGKRPTAGMERNEKIHFVRHLVNHPDFAEKHVSSAGRPSGTTSAAKAEVEKKKKAETSAFSMWAGLGKK